VASRMVQVSPEQLARAQVIAHPEVSPTSQSVLGAGPGTPSGWRTPTPELHEMPHPGGPPSTPPPHVFTRNSPVPANNPSAPPPANNVQTGKPAGTTQEKAAASHPPKTPPKAKTSTTKK
jgi:hypothetical protein